MRPLISYDDLTESQSQDANPVSPPKKRRKPNRNFNRKTSYSGSAAVHDQIQRSQTVAVSKQERSGYGIKEESRYLTREEVWDDSALIEAWNAAAEEYEVLNGPEKRWKKDPVHKSSLWYNNPPEQKKNTSDSNVMSTGMPSIPAAFASHFESSEEMDQSDDDEDQENSRPLDFNTFVPQHDPSLYSSQNIGEATVAQVVPPPPQQLSSVSVDQAFQNAMGAWYWAGYWTGIYHATSNQKTKITPNSHDENHDENDNDGEIEENGEIEDIEQSSEAIDQADLIPT